MQQKTLVDAKIFASRLKSLQAAANIKSSELAREVGVSAPTVSQWRAGRHMPEREIWGKIADLFEREVEDLFFRRTEVSLPQLNEAHAGYSRKDPSFKSLPDRHMLGIPGGFDPNEQSERVSREELEAELAHYLDLAERAGALTIAAMQIRKFLDTRDFQYVSSVSKNKK